MAALIVLATPFTRTISYFAWPLRREHIGKMLHTAADSIMLGCLMAIWREHPRLDRIMNRLSAWQWPCLATLHLLLIDCTLIQFAGGVYSIVIGPTITNLAISFVVLWVIRNPASTPVKLLSTPFMRHAGVISYSLYLWQQLFLTQFNTGWSGRFPINIVLAIMVAEISYWIIERPFLKLRDRFRPTDPPR